jgi:hypothetical protein
LIENHLIPAGMVTGLALVAMKAYGVSISSAILQAPKLIVQVGTYTPQSNVLSKNSSVGTQSCFTYRLRNVFVPLSHIGLGSDSIVTDAQFSKSSSTLPVKRSQFIYVCLLVGVCDGSSISVQDSSTTFLPVPFSQSTSFS